MDDSVSSVRLDEYEYEYDHEGPPLTLLVYKTDLAHTHVRDDTDTPRQTKRQQTENLHEEDQMKPPLTVNSGFFSSTSGFFRVMLDLP